MLRAPLEIDAQIFTEKEVEEMLANNEHNLAKEIVTGNLPTRNAIVFYSVVHSTRYAAPRTR
jgi:hypothetical protein